MKAIKLKDKHAQIIQSMCIGCGVCIATCPHNAKEIHSDVDTIKQWLKTEQVVLSLSAVFPTVSGNSSGAGLHDYRGDLDWR